MASWSVGDRLTHGDNPSLGAGRVVAVAGRAIEVEFPGAGSRLRLAADSPALRPLALRAGQRVRTDDGREGRIAEMLQGGRAALADGTEAPADSLWPLETGPDLASRLAAGDLDPLEDFALRLDALHLAAERQASGLGSFLGGRVRLFPHQLHVAERATATDPVRWLLADEVGLGKTVEACLILNRLVRTRGVERCVVVAPESLTVQWLGELWRKYHQVFVLLDEDRLGDVARDFGRDFNPFETHRRVVVSLETLIAHPRLTGEAVAAGIDLLVVDEAHRLRRPRGHPGNPAYRAVEPIARLGRHVLLLTATPLEDDAHGFFRLLQLLRPDVLREDERLEDRLARAEPLPPGTSCTRRQDIGGLPPRAPAPVALPEGEGWDARAALEAAVLAVPAKDPVARRLKADRLRRALASGAALAAVLGPGDADLKRQAEAADTRDERLAWLAGNARAWKDAGEKTLVFAAHRESLELVRAALSTRAQVATAAFHEQLSPQRRDIEVAQFREAAGPSVLVSTECGGEGRNFEFATRIVLFDLPWSPVVVEQRIGRLDRIGRARDVEIVYFVPPSGPGRQVAVVLESIGLFREPLAGLEPELASVEAALEAAALGEAQAAPRALEEAVRDARAAQERVRAAAYRELHRDPYRPELADSILARVPGGLDALNEHVVVTACERLGIGAERHRGQRTWSFELGNEALVDQLPGVAVGASFLGTFDREEAVADEQIDFFATGHPLVEGVLAHLDDSPRGRVTGLRARLGSETGYALLALYRTTSGFEAILLDAAGRPRPDLAQLLVAPPLRAQRLPGSPAGDAGWREAMAALAALLPAGRPPEALAGLVLGS